jgi:catechol 2,3-dioxygenase-like lactoylglutathione lyase family enzyme
MRIDRLDHLVLTVGDPERTCVFYRDVLGMDAVEFDGGRKALHFGRQKINLHQAGREFEPKARQPTPGSGDLCFIAETPLAEVVEQLRAAGVALESNIVERTGALGPMRSIYFRDPDGNLIEVSNYERA